MYLIFDTETTGVHAEARISQLAWTLYNNDGYPFKKYDSLILPDGWEIPSIEMFLRDGKTQEEAEKRAKFWIDNGFTQAESMAKGVPIATALKHFMDAIEECKYLIAHNFAFDSRILKYEMGLLNLTTVNKPIKFCTMLATVEVCKLPSPRGSGYKWPKLEELHRHLFQCDFNGAHDAGFDVAATGKCFFHMKRNNLISIPEWQNPNTAQQTASS